MYLGWHKSINLVLVTEDKSSSISHVELPLIIPHPSLTHPSTFISISWLHVPTLTDKGYHLRELDRGKSS